MQRRNKIFVAGLIGTLLTFPTVAFAQPKNNAKSQSNKNQNGVSKARADLQQQQRDVAAAAAQIGLAKGGLEQARDKVVDTRNEVVKEKNAAPTLQAARRLWEEARANLAAASAPVLDRLEQDPKYREAVARRDALREQVLNASEKSKSLDALQREYTEAGTVVRQMEKAALQADPRTKAAQEALNREEADVKKLLERKEEEIKSDPQLGAVTQEVRQAKAALAAAQAQYADELRQLAAAEQNLAMKAAQAANKNRKSRRR